MSRATQFGGHFPFARAFDPQAFPKVAVAARKAEV